MDDANDWIMKTNSSLSKLNLRSLTKSEYFRFWGLILAISIGSEPETIGSKRVKLILNNCFHHTHLGHDLGWESNALRIYCGA